MRDLPVIYRGAACRRARPFRLVLAHTPVMVTMTSHIVFGWFLLCFQPCTVAVATILPGITSTTSNESNSFNDTLSSPVDFAHARSTDGSQDSGDFSGD